MNFPINWGTLLVGLKPLGHVAPALTTADVIDFAMDQLVAPDAPRDLLLLASSSSNDSSSVVRHLRKLALSIKFDPTREERKWRLLLVKDLISDIPDSPVEGLTMLTDLWSQLNFPDDSPHIVQGRGNRITPKAYYTADNFKAILRRHFDWISSEEADLRRAPLLTSGPVTMTASEAERRKKMLSVIFCRKGGDGDYAGLFEDLSDAQKSSLLHNINLRSRELPIIGSIKNDGHWVLLTTERLVWSVGGEAEEIPIHAIRDAIADFPAPQVRHQTKLEMDRLIVVTTTDEKHVIELEPRLPLVGFWNVLKNIGARNRHKGAR